MPDQAVPGADPSEVPHAATTSSPVPDETLPPAALQKAGIGFESCQVKADRVHSCI